MGPSNPVKLILFDFGELMELNNRANVSSVKTLAAINASERQGTVQPIGTASAVDVIELLQVHFLEGLLLV